MTRFLQTTQGISNNRFSSLLDLGVFRREEEAKKALQMETVRVYKSKSRKRVYFGTMSLNQTQMMVECCFTSHDSGHSLRRSALSLEAMTAAPMQGCCSSSKNQDQQNMCNLAVA